MSAGNLIQAQKEADACRAFDADRFRDSQPASVASPVWGLTRDGVVVSAFFVDGQQAPRGGTRPTGAMNE